MPSELMRRWADRSQPAYVIAEAGVNHNGDVELAKQLIAVAAEAGADAVKFQTFKAERLVSRTAAKAEYQKRNIGGDDSQFGMLKALELSDDAFRELARASAEAGITLLSTPFDEESADLLADIGVDAFKISSGDLTHVGMLAHIARHGLPMIVSTGMATLDEVGDAVAAVRGTGNTDLALLHCVSNYPAATVDSNLRAMATMESAFGCPVGWSDHTEGSAVCLASVALGARIIEKHFTLSRDLPGPDHKASIEPDELRRLVTDIRAVEASLGSGDKQPTASELPTAKVARRSLVATVDIAAGETLADGMVAVLRPGDGIPPKHLGEIIGRRARSPIAASQSISWDLLE